MGCGPRALGQTNGIAAARDHSLVLRSDGQVRWLEMEDGHVCGIGIRFGGLRARDVWALNKYFESPLEEQR